MDDKSPLDEMVEHAQQTAALVAVSMMALAAIIAAAIVIMEGLK